MNFLRKLLLVLVLLGGILFIKRSSSVETYHPCGEYRVVLALRGYRGPVSFTPGYEYELTSIFRKAISCPVSIAMDNLGTPPSEILSDGPAIIVMPRDLAEGFLEKQKVAYLDSLLAAEGDSTILGHHEVDSLDFPLALSMPLPDNTVWAVHADSVKLLESINIFISHIECSPINKELLSRFTPSHNPIRKIEEGTTTKVASPYDDIFRKEARRIGWDWRMIAAIAWKESSFRLDLKSRKGAIGIMQTIPGEFTEEELLDPETNIRKGCDLLKDAADDYASWAKNETELMKLTLAGYNAGKGRMMDMFVYAETHGMPHSSWSDLEKVIPYLRDESILQDENIRFGIFQGYETIAYVQEMVELYEDFCTILQ